MLRRVLTALVLIPPVVYLIGWSPLWLFMLALLATVEFGLFEYFHLSRQAGFKASAWIGYSAGGLFCLAQLAELRRPGPVLLAALLMVVVLTLALAVVRTADLKDYFGATASTIFGVVYVALTLSCLVPIRFSQPVMGAAWLASTGLSVSGQGRALMLLLFLVIWAGDIFAFLGGRTLGRTLLCPRVSPKKTVEGALFGLAGSLLVAWAFTRWYWQTAEMKKAMLLAAIVAVAGQAGDLAESALKRGANVKDSGTLLPGHGGLLDRIDSLLFGAPALWLVLILAEFWP